MYLYTKTKKNVNTTQQKRNTTRRMPVFHHLKKTHRSRIVGMQTYKVNCGKTLMLGMKKNENALHDYDTPVVVKIYDKHKLFLWNNERIFKKIYNYRNNVKLICDFSCDDETDEYIIKLKKYLSKCNITDDLGHIFIYEYISYGNIYSFFTKNKDIRIIKNIILQIVCLMIQLGEKYGICHGEIYSGNILIQSINEKTIEYQIDDETFTIETYGVMPKVTDYGRSRLMEKVPVYMILQYVIDTLCLINKYIKDAPFKKNIYDICVSNIDNTIEFKNSKDFYIYLRDILM